MAEGREKAAWDRALTIALPIINGFGSFGKDFKPVGFFDFHPYREAPIETAETDKERRDRIMKTQLMHLGLAIPKGK